MNRVGGDYPVGRQEGPQMNRDSNTQADRDRRADLWLHFNKSRRWTHVRNWLDRGMTVEEVAYMWGSEAARVYLRFRIAFDLLMEQIAPEKRLR